VHDLQRRLSAAGFLAPGSAEDSNFCARTHSAVLSFQDSYGLTATGECDEQTWSALIETSWSLGERLLFLRTPNIRGDDVAELQTQLNRLGFNCGRVDGIYGQSVVDAVSEFQRNMGIAANGICSPEFIEFLKQMGSQSGDGPGVAAVRESINLGNTDARDDARLVIGYFTGGTQLAHAILRRAKQSHPHATSVDADASFQAQAANQFAADVYIGCEVSSDDGCIIYFYEVPTFVSVGGRNLALRVAAAVSSRVPELSVRAIGIRHPVLRETRMPAILCSMGPADMVALTTSSLALAITDAFDAWREDPLREI
jgi:N-acetylmuramoyl-L-alanine amidase